MADYLLEYNGISLHPSSDFTVSYQDGLAGAPVRLSTDILTGQHGGAVYASRYNPRVITIQGSIHTTSAESYFLRRRELLNAFSASPLSSELTITTWDGQVYKTSATVLSTPQITDRTGNVTTNMFRIELFCPDPFLLVGSSEEIFTIFPEDSKRGFPLPAPLPMPLGYKAAGSITVITNNGDVPVIPKFRLDGYMVNPVVTNLTTGQSFSITTTIPAGRYVEVFKQGNDDYVLLDGITPFYQNFIGDIFPIGLGNNTIQITATSFDVDALLTISYQNKRNGV